MRAEDAETVGLRALSWIAGDEELLQTFLGQTGIEADDLRQSASDAAVLGAVLDFVLSQDRWVLEFADVCGIPPDTIAEARQNLPGGEQVHWT